MKRGVVLGIIVAAGALSITVAAYQQPPEKPRVLEAQKIRDNLYVLRGDGSDGGNTAVFITATGVIVVDTKRMGWGQPIIDKIKTLTDKPIVTIINTHTHYDHVNGNAEFPPTVDVITHENTKTYMEEGNPVFGVAPDSQEKIVKDGSGRMRRTFGQAWTIGSGKDQVDLRYFGRAHTGGDAFVIFPSLRVMHVGDTFPRLDFPIMDKNNGGTGVGYASTLAKAAAVKNVDTIINGHNPTTTTPADLRLYSEFIADFVKFVQDAKKAGKTVDDVVSTWKTPAKYAGYVEATTDAQRTARASRIKADAQVIWDETK